MTNTPRRGLLLIALAMLANSPVPGWNGLSSLSGAGGQSPVSLPQGSCFLLHEVGVGEIRREPSAVCGMRVSPQSTFKIPHALAGLDAGVIGARLIVPLRRLVTVIRGVAARSHAAVSHAVFGGLVVPACGRETRRNAGARIPPPSGLRQRRPVKWPDDVLAWRISDTRSASARPSRTEWLSRVRHPSRSPCTPGRGGRT